MDSTMVRRAKHTVKQYLHVVSHLKWFRLFVAFVFVLSLFIPTFLQISEARAYALTPGMKKVLGSANKNLSAKFSFDKADNKWQFNKNGTAALASNIAKQHGDKDVEGVAGALSQLAAKQVGGSGAKDTSLYSVDLPVKAEEGVTYYDNVTKLSFKMTPTFASRDAKLVDGRIVYPFSGGGKIVYTAKTNGLKEDIVLSEYVGETLRYGYTLDLPEFLEARLLDDGSIGIYSANPALFGNINFSNDEDKARIMEGRKNGNKDNLVFGIPAPFIKDQQGKAGKTKYELDGKKLTVVAEGLKDLHYPLTVDPSVTVTSSSDFSSGNNEGMIEFNTDQINRGSLTGGGVGTWGAVTTTSDYTARKNSGVATYNGYVYIVGGYFAGGGGSGANSSAVSYAKLTASGTLSSNSCGTSVTWCTGPSVTYGGPIAAVAYNGYLYSIARDKVSNTVEVATINADGSLGAWSDANTGASFSVRFGHTAVAYSGYLYVLGGCGTGNLAQVCPELTTTGSTVYKAEIRANGQLGAWSDANTGASFAARFHHSAVVYNGFMYVLGGCNVRDTAALTQGNCIGTTNDVSYAKVNTDGTLGVWASTTAFSTARLLANAVIHNGYLYILPGCDNGNGGCQGGTLVNETQYAPIYANGTVGAWQTTSTLAAARYGQGAVVSSGYVYQFGGCSNSSLNCGAHTNYLGSTQSSKVDLAGAIAPYSTLADFDTNTRKNAAVVAGNGYLYILGGQLNGSGNGVNTGRYAAINADGSLGTWNAVTAFADHRLGPAAVIYGNSLYLIGGSTNTSGTGNCSFVDSGASRTCTKVERATIDPSTGQLTWVDSFTYYVDNPRGDLTAVVNGGYFYVIGGIYSNNSVESAEVDFASINADGTLGTFTKTTAQLSTQRGEGVGAVAWNGRIYVVGGRENMTAEYATPNAATGDITSWSSAGNALPDVGGQATRQMAVSGTNGYIYVTGGLSTSLNITNATQIAKINADGTLGNWIASPQTMTNNLFAHGSTVYNGVLYVAAGCTGTLCTSGNQSQSYQYAKINNGGNGSVGTWGNKGSFTTARSQAATAAYGDYIYLTGGCTTATGIAGCTTSTNDTRYAQVAVDGTLTWSALDSNVPTNRFGHASVTYNGYLYVIGGCSSTGGTNGFCTSFLNDVQRVKLNSNGNTTGNSWGSAGTTLGTGRYGLSATAHNGYMYVTGGCSATTSGNCSTAQQTVEYAQINADGSLGSWSSTGGSGFATSRFLHGAVAYAGKLYVAGGCSAMSSGNCTTMQNDIQFATINGNGTISSTWNLAGYFPTARYGASLTAQNGAMYLSGGCSVNSSGGCTTFQTDIQTASIGASGNIGLWRKQITAYSDPRYLHSSTMVNGYLYLFGGTKSGPTLLADSMGSVLQALSRIGRYSKILTVNPTTDIAGVYYNGSLDGGSRVEYKVAPSSGVFGAATAATQGTGSEPTPLCGVGAIYYIQVLVTIGDNTNSVFTDDNTSNVTDITIYYRLNATPPPNLRLNGGKWFYAETQQPLDICKA